MTICSATIDFDLLSVVLNDILHDNLDFFVLRRVSLQSSCRITRTVARPLAVMVLTLVVRLLSVLVRSQNLDQVKVVTCACVPIDNDKAVFQTHLEHTVKELHIRLAIKILPSPLKLMQELCAIWLETLPTKALSQLPHVM